MIFPSSTISLTSKAIAELMRRENSVLVSHEEGLDETECEIGSGRCTNPDQLPRCHYDPYESYQSNDSGPHGSPVRLFSKQENQEIVLNIFHCGPLAL